jgi:hypothetical protein
MKWKKNGTLTKIRELQYNSNRQFNRNNMIFSQGLTSDLKI